MFQLKNMVVGVFVVKVDVLSRNTDINTKTTVKHNINVGGTVFFYYLTYTAISINFRRHIFTGFIHLSRRKQHLQNVEH